MNAEPGRASRWPVEAQLHPSQAAPPPASTVLLTTPRLVIRPLQGDDLPAWLAYQEESHEAHRSVFPEQIADPLLRFDEAIERARVTGLAGSAYRLAAFERSAGTLRPTASARDGMSAGPTSVMPARSEMLGTSGMLGEGEGNALRRPRLIGLVNFNAIVRGASQNAALGYSVNPLFERQGLAFEMTQAALSFAFSAPPLGAGLHRIIAYILPGNLRSRRLAERLGFQFEGIARRFLRIAGSWQDHQQWSLLDDEWSPRL